ncbi:MAG: hypothetical protein ACRDLQ_05620 [Solirubrobacterales bacterium]
MASTGPAGGNGPLQARFAGIAERGPWIFFHTNESLVAEDQDLCPGHPDFGDPPFPCQDVYARDVSRGLTRLVSTGTPGSGPHEALFRGATPDGRFAFFETPEPLVPEDRDRDFDTYRHDLDAQRTTLVAGGGSEGERDRGVFGGVSDDGDRVFIETRAKLGPQDSDELLDVYEVRGEAITLVSTGPGDTGNVAGVIDGNSPDGTRVFFNTGAALVPEDRDARSDLYERSAGTTTLISRGGVSPEQSCCFQLRFLDAIASNGDVFFSTNERLVAEDDDDFCFTGLSGCTDVYRHSGGTVSLMSQGPVSLPGHNEAYFGGITPDGERVFFITLARLAPDDTDASFDVYERHGDVTSLVSIAPTGGNGAPNAFFGAVSDDGGRVYFDTWESLVPEDRDRAACPPDGCFDVYERVGGVVKLVSTTPGAGGAGHARFAAASADGERVVFETDERLLPEDTDDEQDVYERHRGGVSLISVGAGGGNGPHDSFFSGASLDLSTIALTTSESLLAADTDAGDDVYAATLNRRPDCSEARAFRGTLWPPNRAFVSVAIDVVTDPDGGPPSVQVHSVRQDEPVTGRADRTSPDARLAEDRSGARLRAERDPRGDGRVYVIAFTATDAHGGRCSGEVRVGVPRHRRSAARDSSPPSHDSLQP